jgi:hypothetical protein
VSAKVRGILKTMGDKTIVSAEVVRSPVQSIVQQAINFVSGGEFKKAIADKPYDDIFHLMIVLTLEDGKKYSLEKNAIITLRPTKGRSGESMSVSVPSGLTLNKALEKTSEAMGDLYATYSAKSNNCQDFIIALLQGAGLLTTDVATFVKQPLEKVLAGLPGYTQKLARLATDAGAVFNVALQGRGGLKPGPAFERQLTKAGISPLAYLDAARKAAKKAGLAHEYLGFSDNDIHKLQIPNEEGKIIRFGRVGHGDFLYYSLTKDPKAAEHRKSYRARATKIRGNWAKDAYSPNSLAIAVLW